MTSDPARLQPRRRSPVLIFALSFALLAGGAASLSAQAGQLVQITENQLPGLATVSPSSGASGTMVKVATKNLPARTEVQFMIGALQDGFEVISTVMTDEQGRPGGQDTVAVKIPDWVQTNRSYLVMLTDLNYKPLAAPNMFHPTDASGGLQRRGTMKSDDPRCPMLTAPGGENYFLVGNTTGLRSGNDVIVKGKVTDFTPCGRTTTISVESSRPAR